MKKDETTRKKVEHGERPLLYPHLVFLVLNVVPTMLARDKHECGHIARVLHSYCIACTASGLGSCIHGAAGLWVQRHHWDKDRNIEKPSTIKFCAWLNAGMKRITQAIRTRIKNAGWSLCKVLGRSGI
jgi:hypothetical protein